MQNNQFHGVVQANMRGFGFAMTKDGERYFIAPSLLKKLFPDDVIAFTAIPGRQQGLQVNEVTLLSRKAKYWMGVLRDVAGHCHLEPDDPCFVPIRVARPADYREGDVVCVRVAPEGLELPATMKSLPATMEGNLVQNLGPRARSGFEQQYALAKYGFSAEFPQEVEALCEELQQRGVPAPVPGVRKDLRHLPFLTIDSATTQDFDDALLVVPTEFGWNVLVAIADVSHYVTPGSPLDACAQERGTSVYLPEKTVPMLPKVLSAGLCALKAGEPRLAVILDMQLNHEGSVQSTLVYRATIKVLENLTYDYVYAQMQNKSPENGGVEEILRGMTELYLLRSQVEQPPVTPGAEAPEPTWKRGEDGAYFLEWVTRNSAHKLVESFMLLANQRMALLLEAQQGAALFRHQALPSGKKWDVLRDWAQTKGIDIPDVPTRNALVDLSNALAPCDYFGGQMQIRSSMTTAVYEPEQPSHFSLGYSAYTHFTSPIRRYADLLVHRLVLGELVEPCHVIEIAEQCSVRSKGAKFAERYVWDKIKKRVIVKSLSEATNVSAFIASQSRFGLRVVLTTWQCMASVSGRVMAGQGYAFNYVAQAWERTGGNLLGQGEVLSVGGFSLEEFKAKTELVCNVVTLPGGAPAKNQAVALGLLTS